MNLRSLVVYLDGTTRCDVRTQLAARVAAAHGCHLVGVAPIGPLELDATPSAAARFLDEATHAREVALHRAAEWTEQFIHRCHALGVLSVVADIYQGDPATVLLHHAHCADAAVIGQADPASPTFRDERRFVEQVLLHNARPTLLVPHAGQPGDIAETVLVAWDDSRASARATADAIPWLRRAAQVHLIAWRRSDELAEAAVHERLLAVQRWLAQHGVNALARVQTTRVPIGEALLQEAAAIGADLVVMGTYGHSRWSERLLGGVTRTALASSPVPLLMSH
jgi:nucleotide-binding universal stress UspA family protein